MESRVNQKIEDYFNTLKQNIIDIAEKTCDEQQTTILKNYLNNSVSLQLTKSDFTKRKRIKNVVPFYDRCCAYRANGERCTRRRKGELQFCGTHNKGQPHGVVSDKDEPATTMVKKITVHQQDIRGIIYYIDDECNVYDPQDIMNGIKNPKIIAKYELDENVYRIPAFGV